MYDRYLIEARVGRFDWYPAYEDGVEIAESMDRAVEQVLHIAKNADEIRVTRFNDETPARNVTEDILDLAFLEWDATHDLEHGVPEPLQAAYDRSNIRRDDPERGN